MRPPRLAVWLLEAVLPRGELRASVPGDLEEEWRELAERSAWRGTLWYWSQTLRMVPRFAVHGVARRIRAGVSRPPVVSKPRRNGLMATILRDVRYGFRSLRRAPAFALTAIVTVGLGIGAATAVFSVVHGVLLRPFDYEDPDRLAVVWLSTETHEQSWLAGPEIEFIRENARTIESTAGLWPDFYTLTGDGPAEQLRGGDVSPELFGMLGVRAALGRTLRAGDDVSGEGVVVLSDGLWRTRYGSARDVVGRAMMLDGEPYTIVGVMPPDFTMWLPEDGLFHDRPDIWLPLRLEDWPNLDNHSLLTLVRTRDGIAWGAIESELSAISASYRERYAGEVAETMRFVPVGLQADVVAEARPVLVALFGAVAFVVLLVCANVANLMLVRSGERSNEMAVRGAVGAGRGALVRQLLVESLLIAVAGGILGTAIALGALSLLLRFAPPDLPRLADLTVGGPVLAFAGLTVLVTTVLFGLAPAIQTGLTPVATLLRGGGRGASTGRAGVRQRTALVIGQFALAFVLVMSSVLLIRSFVALRAVDPGFTPDGVLTMQVRLPSTAYADSRARFDRFVLPVVGSLRTIPGVRSAGVVSALPFTADFRGGHEWVERDDGTRHAVQPVDIRFASGGYFEAMSARLAAGRFFDERDNADSPPVAVVDETFASEAWPGQDPVGRRIANDSTMSSTFEVIGVVRHINHFALDEEHRPQVYFPAAVTMPSLMSFTIGFAGPPQAVADAARSAVQGVDPQLAVTRVTTMRQLVDASLSTDRFQTALFTLFGIVALVLAAIGIYGVIAFGVARRRREFGVRLALGATTGDVQRMVVGSGIRMAGTGLGIGLAGALLASRLLGRFLFGIRATDVTTVLSVGAALAVVALLAAWIPARRATRADPAGALRAD